MDDILSKAFAFYGLLLIVLGSFFNALTCFVCLKSSKLSANCTFKFLAFIALTDIIAMIISNLQNFTQTFFDFSLYNSSLFVCQFVSVFLQFSAAEFSNIMWLSISVNQYLSLTVKDWSKEYFGGSRPLIYTSLILICVLSVNSFEIFTIGYIDSSDNYTQVIVCYADNEDDYFWYDVSVEIYVWLYAAIPFFLQIVFNFLIIVKAIQFVKRQQQQIDVIQLATLPGIGSPVATDNSGRSSATPGSRGRIRIASMTVPILVVTFLYITCSLPNVLASYFYVQISTADYGQFVTNLFADIKFSFMPLNFVILFFSNKMFAHEVRENFYIPVVHIVEYYFF